MGGTCCTVDRSVGSSVLRVIRRHLAVYEDREALNRARCSDDGNTSPKLFFMWNKSLPSCEMTLGSISWRVLCSAVPLTAYVLACKLACTFGSLKWITWGYEGTFLDIFCEMSFYKTRNLEINQYIDRSASVTDFNNAQEHVWDGISLSQTNHGHPLAISKRWHTVLIGYLQSYS